MFNNLRRIPVDLYICPDNGKTWWYGSERSPKYCPWCGDLAAADHPVTGRRALLPDFPVESNP